MATDAKVNHAGLYVIQCVACNKQFKRKKYSTRTNKHKDKYGNQCFGRSGYEVNRYYRS